MSHGVTTSASTVRWRAVLALAASAVAAFAAAAQAGNAPVVTEAWARATPPGVEVGAVYMTITGGAGDDRLVGASCDRAAMVAIHTVEEQAGVARMREIESLDVPAGRKVVLAPMSTHLMLMGLDGPLVAGQSFTVALRFAASGTQDVAVQVKPAAAGDGH
jgi:copper(I)-binding protein